MKNRSSAAPGFKKKISNTKANSLSLLSNLWDDVNRAQSCNPVSTTVRHVGLFPDAGEASVIQPLLRDTENLEAYRPYLDTHPDFRAISFGRHISVVTMNAKHRRALGCPHC